MILLFHQNGYAEGLSCNNKLERQPMADALLAAAKQHPGELLIWCHSALKEGLNASEMEVIFHHRKIMASFNPCEPGFLPDAIGYVEDTPFIKINKNVRYPSWRMSSLVGGVHASVLLALENELILGRNFDYFLHSLGKTAMPQGLLCYSEPKLLLGNLTLPAVKQANNQLLFRFVKQHYKTRWVFLLLFNLWIYEKKFPFMAFLSALFYRKRKFSPNILESINVQSSLTAAHRKTIDVIIPTIGRKKYLYDVLKDLAAQTNLPEKVIIVEQNPEPESTSELDYLTGETWPFQIKHHFIHQTGACNARNLALEEVTSEWVFLADDDIRFDAGFIKDSFAAFQKYGQEAFTVNCLQRHEKNLNPYVSQTSTFGSGCSFLHAGILTRNIRFSMKFEHGYGEDTDFGMQLRNLGFDVIFLPKPEILHLKAPMGGFRINPILTWQQDLIKPKPSPTVMLFRQLYYSAEQLNGYKTMLFFKFYKHQKIKNPIRYFLNFQKSWSQSLNWAKKLRGEN
jgi:GT2 family glycosyltransferase